MIILFIIILLSFLEWKKEYKSELLAKQIANELDRKAKEEQNHWNLVSGTRRGDDLALAIRLKNSPHMRKPHSYSSYPDDSSAYLENDPNNPMYIAKGVKHEKKK